MCVYNFKQELFSSDEWKSSVADMIATVPINQRRLYSDLLKNVGDLLVDEIEEKYKEDFKRFNQSILFRKDN